MAVSCLFAGCGGGSGASTPAPTGPANSAPVAVAGFFSTSEIVTISGQVEGRDADGDALTFDVVTPPSKGSFRFFDESNGDFAYEPDPSQDLEDSFTFTVSDGGATSAPATVTILLSRWGDPKQFGSPAGDFASTGGIVPAASGAVIGGFTEGSIDGTPNAGNTDAWVRRNGSRGNQVWLTQFGTPAQDYLRNLLGLDDDGGVFAVVAEAPDATSSPAGASIYKLDENGVVIWEQPVDFEGRIMNYGGYWSTWDSLDIYMLSWTEDGNALNTLLTRIDSEDGSVIWSVELESSATDPVTPFIDSSDRVQARGIAIDDGGLYVTGTFTDDIDNPTRNCETCSWLARFDKSGEQQWVREVSDLATVCGPVEDIRLFRTAELGGGSGILSVVGSVEGRFTDQAIVVGYDTFLLQGLIDDNAALEEQWIYCDVTPDGDSLVYTDPVTTTSPRAYIYYSVELGEDPVTMQPASDIVVLLLNALDGSPVWRSRLSETRSDGSPAQSLAGGLFVDRQDLIYIFGSTDGEVLPGSQQGNEDIFIRRLDADGNPR